VIASGQYRPTILVIDDQPTIRKTVSRVLERAGYQVRAAGTAGEALDLLRAVAALCPAAPSPLPIEARRQAP
jgi:CheY-like chemotaxis protein